MEMTFEFARRKQNARHSNLNVVSWNTNRMFGDDLEGLMQQMFESGIPINSIFGFQESCNIDKDKMASHIILRGEQANVMLLLPVHLESSIIYTYVSERVCLAVIDDTCILFYRSVTRVAVLNVDSSTVHAFSILVVVRLSSRPSSRSSRLVSSSSSGLRSPRLAGARAFVKVAS